MTTMRTIRGQETKGRILEEIRNRNGITAQTIARWADVSVSTARKYAAQLVDDGLVRVWLEFGYGAKVWGTLATSVSTRTAINLGQADEIAGQADAGQADEVKVDAGAALDSLRDAVRSAIEKSIVAGVDPDDATRVLDELAGRGDGKGGPR
jgi:predicted ArsR family transcriptional regulator